MSNKAKITDLEWENRVLCSDESCIGVIGTDGCCKECGKAYEGDLPTGFADQADCAASPIKAAPPSSASSVEMGDDADSATGKEAGQESMDDEEWTKRTLCRDEACIGVIGPDGNCKECGMPYNG